MPVQDDTTPVIGQTRFRFQMPHEYPRSEREMADNWRAIDRVINGLPMGLLAEDVETAWFKFRANNPAGVMPETGDWTEGGGILENTIEITWDVPLPTTDGSDIDQTEGGETFVTKSGLWQITPRAHILVPSVIDRIAAKVYVVVNDTRIYSAGSNTHYPGDNEEFIVGTTIFVTLPKGCTVGLRVWMYLFFQTGELGAALTTRFLEIYNDEEEAGCTGIDAHWITALGGGDPGDPDIDPET